MQPHREGRDLAHGLLAARLGPGVTLPADRGDGLFDEPDLAVRGGLERAQVPRLQAVAGQLAGGARHDQRVPVEVLGPRTQPDQPVGDELVDELLVDLRGLGELALGQPQLLPAGREGLRGGKAVAGQDDAGHLRPVAIDFYNNVMTNFHDNPFETDGGMHNVRVMRNLMLNSASHAFCNQPTIGGPTYWVRNIGYHLPGWSTRLTSGSAGVLFFNNTILSETTAAATSNTHWVNNLILGEQSAPVIWTINTLTNYSSSDYNGFRPNPSAPFSFGEPDHDRTHSSPRRSVGGSAVAGSARA